MKEKKLKKLRGGTDKEELTASQEKSKFARPTQTGMESSIMNTFIFKMVHHLHHPRGLAFKTALHHIITLILISFVKDKEGDE